MVITTGHILDTLGSSVGWISGFARNYVCIAVEQEEAPTQPDIDINWGRDEPGKGTTGKGTEV